MSGGIGVAVGGMGVDVGRGVEVGNTVGVGVGAGCSPEHARTVKTIVTMLIAMTRVFMVFLRSYGRTRRRLKCTA